MYFAKWGGSQARPFFGRFGVLQLPLEIRHSEFGIRNLSAYPDDLETDGGPAFAPFESISPFAAHQLPAEGSLRCDHDNLSAVLMNFEASLGRSDKIMRALFPGLEFNQGRKIDGLRRPEGLEVEFLERFDGGLGFRRLSRLGSRQIGRFQSAGVVFIFRLALRIGGLGMRRHGSARGGDQFLPELRDDLLQQDSFVYQGRIYATEQIRPSSSR